MPDVNFHDAIGLTNRIIGTLNIDGYVMGQATVTLGADLPAYLAVKGAPIDVKIGVPGTLFEVTAISGSGNRILTITRDTQTADADYPQGTPVYLEISARTLERFRDVQFLTAVDETSKLPNSAPVSSVLVSDLSDGANVIMEGDARLTDDRDPTAHAATHELGGLDEILLENMATAETDTTLTAHPDGLGGVVWGPDLGSGGGGGGASEDYVLIQEQQAQNTNGSNITANTWQKRVLNTEVVDTASIASIASDQITLAAGTYRCRARGVVYTPQNHQMRLYNVTDSVVIAVGLSQLSQSGGNNEDVAELTCRFTLASTKTLELQHNASVAGIFGVPRNVTTEIYAEIEFWRESAPVTPGLVLLEEHIASASAQLDFTAWRDDALYDDYLIKLSNIRPVTDAVDLLMRMSTDGGSSYDSGANYGWRAFIFTTGATAVGGAEGGATSIPLNYAVGHLGNDANRSYNATIYLYAPGGANYKEVSGQILYFSQDSFRVSGNIGGSYESTTAVDALRFFMSSGNIASGTISIYGLAKS